MLEFSFFLANCVFKSVVNGNHYIKISRKQYPCKIRYQKYSRPFVDFEVKNDKSGNHGIENSQPYEREEIQSCFKEYGRPGKIKCKLNEENHYGNYSYRFFLFV